MRIDPLKALLTRWLLLALLGMAGCVRAPLPPHVWMPIERVIGVDLFWWTDQQICQLRVIYEGGSTGAQGFTATVESSLCLARLKADGFQMPVVEK